MSEIKAPEFDIDLAPGEHGVKMYTRSNIMDLMMKRAAQQIMDFEDAEILRILGGTASSSLTSQRIYRCF